MIRFLPVLVLFGCLIAVGPLSANQPDFSLRVVPGNVYKVDDPGNTNTSSFVFDIAVICSKDCDLKPISARVELSSGGVLVERQEWLGEQLSKNERTSYRVQPDTPVAWPTRAFSLPEAFDLRFYFRNPQVLAVDSAAVRLTVADAKGRRADQMLKIPVQYYQQKTPLIFPIRGPGVVGQDWITNGGHKDYSNGFALDLRGTDNSYAEMKNGVYENETTTGWGREILAPAAGTVVYARNDVPTNNAGTQPDDTLYTKLHDPVEALAGNCVIIDHGNSEYSVLMHMQTGSVTVKVGDRVNVGQVIGKLGNSGSSGGPHLHYQLQTGPELWRYQSLPIKFQNINGLLYRGREFQAK